MATVGVLVAVVLLSGVRAADELKVPLKTELPKPSMRGNGPRPIPAVPVEPELQGGRPDFMIPQGCTNLALGKKVFASKRPVKGQLSQITDGIKDSEDEALVALEAGTQWIQIDLGATQEIFAVLIWRRVGPKCVYFAVAVQVSDDAKFRKNTQTLFNSDRENVHGLGAGTNLGCIESYQGQLIDAMGAKGRYVRLYSCGNTADKMNHYTEVEVWGRPDR